MPVKFNDVSHEYSPNSPFSYVALDHVNVELPMNKIVAIVGNTGSGKSTLVQHLNALLKPTSGSVEILDRVIKADEKAKNLKSLRKLVGLVFQFPEYQLFEETIGKDLCFGPKNFGVSEEDAFDRAKQALKQVGLDESYLERSPFDLSGGQKRRVAIAGILAMEPEILVLDEPTAGLDPQGTKQMMKLFYDLNKVYGKTVYIVTHDMEHVLNYCDEVIVMRDGHMIHQSDTVSFFAKKNLLDELHIAPPQIIKAKRMLEEQGFTINEENTMEALVEAIVKGVQR